MRGVCPHQKQAERCLGRRKVDIIKGHQSRIARHTEGLHDVYERVVSTEEGHH